jgi:NADH:ubiquinone oxidoreductase subunit E
MVQINDDFHENLTIESLDRLISDIAAKTAVGSS